jgi:Domain of unknown function (DUF4410)
MKGSRHVFVRASMLVAAAAVLSTMTACTPAKVEPLQSYQGSPLPRPEIVVVKDFIAGPDQVKLDSGLGARLRNAVSGDSASARQIEDDRKVQAAISKTLVGEVQKLGLPAMQSNDAVAQIGGNTLVVGGQILSIDEGNRTRRNIIGLGAGRSEVKARTEVYYHPSGAGARLIDSFQVDVESSRKPGAAETMGVGAATGRVAESAAVGVGTSVAPALSADVTADGERMAKAIAKQLAALFVRQGWISAH